MIKKIFEKPYVYFLILIFLIYLILNIIISQFYITVQYIPRYLETIKWTELILSGIFSLTIGLLISINAVILYIKFKERKEVKKQTILVGLGAVGGLATGICSACVAGLFPLVLGLLGISFSFLSLPFKGLEVQVLVILVLVINLYFLNKNNKICKPNELRV